MEGFCESGNEAPGSLKAKLFSYSSAYLPSGLSVGRSNIKQVAERRRVDIERFLSTLFLMADEISHSDIVYTFFHPLLRDQQEANINAAKVKGPTTLKLGVMDAICHFNCGNEVELDIFWKMSITPGKYTNAVVNTADETLTLNVYMQCTLKQQQRRRYWRTVEKRKIDLKTQGEGLTYVAGQF
ncbi:hypothetical protein ANN_22718 [Periplaneta americana]|uniref:PX domain-containing protein n=1 Tax=Periplaneta americana TaxID=6978 RepID=A0ABQ8S983_PERAM|nr:hypothetical protein ANN_22718 [Periplaneta americana]